MKRLNTRTNKFVENKKIDDFIEAVIELSKQHGLSVCHEDGHGAFEIEDYDEFNSDWLRNAYDSTKS